jgi:hypothetical protein
MSPDRTHTNYAGGIASLIDTLQFPRCFPLWNEAEDCIVCGTLTAVSIPDVMWQMVESLPVVDPCYSDNNKPSLIVAIMSSTGQRLQASLMSPQFT